MTASSSLRGGATSLILRSDVSFWTIFFSLSTGTALVTFWSAAYFLSSFWLGSDFSILEAFSTFAALVVFSSFCLSSNFTDFGVTFEVYSYFLPSISGFLISIWDKFEDAFSFFTNLDFSDFCF